MSSLCMENILLLIFMHTIYKYVLFLDINFKNGETDIEVLCNRLAKSIKELDTKKSGSLVALGETELKKEGGVETGMAKS